MSCDGRTEPKHVALSNDQLNISVANNGQRAVFCHNTFVIRRTILPYPLCCNVQCTQKSAHSLPQAKTLAATFLQQFLLSEIKQF